MRRAAAVLVAGLLIFALAANCVSLVVAQSDDGSSSQGNQGNQGNKENKGNKGNSGGEEGSTSGQPSSGEDEKGKGSKGGGSKGGGEMPEHGSSGGSGEQPGTAPGKSGEAHGKSGEAHSKPSKQTEQPAGQESQSQNSGGNSRSGTSETSAASVTSTAVAAVVITVSAVAVASQSTTIGNEFLNVFPEKLRKFSKLLGLPFWAIFTGILERLNHNDILNNDTRAEIYEHINDHPGTHLREIMGNLGIGPNAANYHLYVLERFKLVKSERFGNFRIYYPANGREAATQGKARFALRYRVAKKIVEHLKKNPGAYESEVARALRVHHNTIRHHVNRLIEANIVSCIRDRGYAKLFLADSAKQYVGEF